jgi:cyclic-di-GMP-binding protein
VLTVAADSSFDVVSKLDRQEVDNALNQAAKEVSQRYDFKGTDASVAWRGDDAIRIEANSEERATAVLDVLQTKLVKRGVSLKALDSGEPKASGKVYVIDSVLKEGLSQENAKKIGKLIRDEGPKGVKAQITGDEMRVSSKSRDDLQAVIQLLKGADLDVALQFVNYR